MDKTLVAKWRKSLEGLNGPTEMLKDFDSLTKLGGDIKHIIIEICIKHNFTKPFESDGKPRAIRHYLKTNSDFSGDIIEESGYRRGYDQGFKASLSMWQNHKSIAEAEKVSKEVKAWRIRPFQILDSPPGSEEGEKEWLLKWELVHEFSQLDPNSERSGEILIQLETLRRKNRKTK